MIKKEKRCHTVSLSIKNEKVQGPTAVDSCPPKSCGYAGLDYLQSVQGQLNRGIDGPKHNPTVQGTLGRRG